MEKINNLLEIILITYNRKPHLARTLGQLFAENSPVKNLNITVLDNASTDGSSEMLVEFALKYPNLKHLRHKKNIGGNANIARAFEIAAKEYLWILCDDDELDFSTFNKLQEALDKKPAAVVVANYINPQKNKALLFKQMSFVPSTIYRTDLINDAVLINANFNISNMFPQLAVAAATINSKKEVIILEKPLVKMIVNCGEYSYIRGAENGLTHPLMKDMFWELGYLNSVKLLTDKQLRKTAIKYCQPQNKDFGEVVLNVARKTINKGNIRYFFDFIFNLDFRHFILFLILYLCSIQKGNRGIYVRIFAKIRFKIIPFSIKNSYEHK